VPRIGDVSFICCGVQRSATRKPVTSTKSRQSVSIGNFFTIGYEQSSIRRFLSLLRSREVEILVDVREIPLSRKPGFSKNHLSASLENAGIEYRHIVNLGAPKKLREKLRSGGSWWDYTKG
jgi:hypothetical protein